MEMAEILAALHRRVREALAGGLPLPLRTVADGSGELNPKGDVRHPFDLAADELVLEELEALCPGGLVLTEERSGCVAFGRQPARHLFVVDPVDGSDNHGRGLPLSAVSIAVLDGEGPLDPDRVAHALVGPLDGGEAFLAARGAGAWQGTTKLETSGVQRIEDALVSCELNHWAPDPRLAVLLSRCRGVRSYGCASRAIALVARGALDAHIDIRNRLTPESFLAASLLLTEAGGRLCRPDGTPVGPFASIRDRTALVAAAGMDLATDITAALAG